MKKKTMMIIGFTLLMSQFMYGDPNMDRLLNEARKRQAAEKAEIDKQERESSKEVSNKVEKEEKKVYIDEEVEEEASKPKTAFEKLEYNSKKALEKVDYYERVVRSVAREEDELNGYKKTVKNKK